MVKARFGSRQTSVCSMTGFLSRSGIFDVFVLWHHPLGSACERANGTRTPKFSHDVIMSYRICVRHPLVDHSGSSASILTAQRRKKPEMASYYSSSSFLFRDETFLEAFVESLTTLPHEVRRDLDLLQSLDRSCG
jgi:hypothetical protein